MRQHLPCTSAHLPSVCVSNRLKRGKFTRLRLSELPGEILEEICAHIEHQPDIQAATLTCRALCREAQKQLFSRVRISLSFDDDTGHHERGGFKMHNERLRERLCGILQLPFGLRRLEIAAIYGMPTETLEAFRGRKEDIRQRLIILSDYLASAKCNFDSIVLDLHDRAWAELVASMLLRSPHSPMHLDLQHSDFEVLPASTVEGLLDKWEFCSSLSIGRPITHFINPDISHLTTPSATALSYLPVFQRRDLSSRPWQSGPSDPGINHRPSLPRERSSPPHPRRRFPGVRRHSTGSSRHRHQAAHRSDQYRGR